MKMEEILETTNNDIDTIRACTNMLFNIDNIDMDSLNELRHYCADNIDRLLLLIDIFIEAERNKKSLPEVVLYNVKNYYILKDIVNTFKECWDLSIPLKLIDSKLHLNTLTLLVDRIEVETFRKKYYLQLMFKMSN